MGGVRGDGEGVGEDPAYYLGHHEDQAEAGGQDQLPSGSENISQSRSLEVQHPEMFLLAVGYELYLRTARF